MSTIKPHLTATPNGQAAVDHAVKRKPSLFAWLVDGLNSLGSLLIFGMMLLICSDVGARWLFNHPIYGVAEIVSLTIVAIVFLQLGSTLRHQRMARADIFIDGFIERSPRLGHLLQALFNLLGLATCGVIFAATGPLFLGAWREGEYLGVQGLFTAPIWPIRLIVLIGALVTAIQYLLHIIADCRACLVVGKAQQE